MDHACFVTCWAACRRCGAVRRFAAPLLLFGTWLTTAGAEGRKCLSRESQKDENEVYIRPPGCFASERGVSGTLVPINGLEVLRGIVFSPTTYSRMIFLEINIKPFESRSIWYSPQGH